MEGNRLPGRAPHALVRKKVSRKPTSRPGRWGRGRRAALLGFVCTIILFGTLISGTACSPSTEEGAERDFKVESRAGIVTVKGQQRFTGGEWLKHGPFTFYDDRGDVVATGHYEDGLETGAWTETYEDRCTGRGMYVEGQRSGPWQTFHPKGMPQDSGEYDRGLRTGLWLSYRRDGTKLREAEYQNGQENGRVVCFGPDGLIVNHELSGTYKNGERKKPLAGQ